MNITKSSKKSKNSDLSARLLEVHAQNLQKLPENLAAQGDGEERAAPGAAGCLGRLTKFVEKKRTIDPETGEICFYDLVADSSGAVAPVLAYDQAAEDLERWILKAAARKCLMKIDERSKRVRVPYSKFCYYTDLGEIFDITTGQVVRFPVVKSILVEPGYKLEQAFIHTGRTERDPAQLAEQMAAGAFRSECLVSSVNHSLLVAQTANKPRFRVINCGRDKIGKTVNPEVWQAAESKRCSYHKVSVCGSVWTCPQCSRKINLRRQKLVAAAFETFVNSRPLVEGKPSGDAVMITFTVKHGLGDALTDDESGAGLLSRLKAADRIMQRSHAYKKIIGYAQITKGVRYENPSTVDYVGRVSATEINHGANGWHPHVHGLWFFDRRLSDLELVQLRRGLFAEWAKACQAVGLPAPIEMLNGKAIGVDVRRAHTAQEYLTKFCDARQWSVEKELVGQHVKTAKRGRSAFQLLADYAQGDQQAGALFRVFSEATLGRHQLEFSKGLKVRLLALCDDEITQGLNETDEQAAAQLEETSSKVGALTDDDFMALCDAEKHCPAIEPFGLLLNLCASQGFDFALAWLRSLPSYRPGSRIAATVALDEARLPVLVEAFEKQVERLGSDGLAVGLEDDFYTALHYETDQKTKLRDLGGFLGVAKLCQKHA